MHNPNTYNLHIIGLNCYRQDESDGDEVFIKYKKERVWPLDSKYKKVTEGNHEVNFDIVSVTKGEIVALELWDYDLLTANDKLGVFSMLVNERGGPFTTDLSSSTGSSKYSLEWEVH